VICIALTDRAAQAPGKMFFLQGLRSKSMDGGMIGDAKTPDSSTVWLHVATVRLPMRTKTMSQISGLSSPCAKTFYSLLVDSNLFSVGV